MNTVFADAFYWIASVNPKDTWHQAVIDWTRSNAEKRILTTDEVLSEVLAFYSKRGQVIREMAVKLVRHVIDRPDITVIPQSRDSFLAGFELFEKRPDKGYSLTDCISMQTMNQHNITDVLTHDYHFTQEGFSVLFKSLS